MSFTSTVDALLAAHGIDPATEVPFENDGWSGATLTRLHDGDGRPYVLKRDSFERDWIAQATHDEWMREIVVAHSADLLPAPIRYSALGAVREREQIAILMPDLTDVLFDWNATISIEQLDTVLAAMAALHDETVEAFEVQEAWTGWEDRITLIGRPSLERPGPAHDAVASRLLPGWDAWDRVATPRARSIIEGLSEDVEPLLDALGAERSGLIHGDLKLANVGIARDGVVEMVDWQMVATAPAAVELGWFLVANVNSLTLTPSVVLDRYWAIRGSDAGRENDLAILVGLLLRGWRKGLDAEAGVILASGVSAADDLAWWCDRAVEAAGRIL